MAVYGLLFVTSTLYDELLVPSLFGELFFIIWLAAFAIEPVIALELFIEFVVVTPPLIVETAAIVELAAFIDDAILATNKRVADDSRFGGMIGLFGGIGGGTLRAVWLLNDCWFDVPAIGAIAFFLAIVDVTAVGITVDDVATGIGDDIVISAGAYVLLNDQNEII